MKWGAVASHPQTPVGAKGIGEPAICAGAGGGDLRSQRGDWRRLSSPHAGNTSMIMASPMRVNVSMKAS